MVDVLGIIGSPRKDGRTNSLVDAALEGARSRGAVVEKVYLVDYAIRPFTGIGGAADAFQYCPEELSVLCEAAGAIVLGAPVYWGDISGITKDFMDSVRISNCRGKPALGIAIAGGSGKGLLSGVQSIYHFFFHKQMMAIDPTPVSRFNMEEALAGLRVSGARLADLSRQARPHLGPIRDEGWPEAAAHYATLDYLRCDPVDEFVMLAQQLIRISQGGKVEAAQGELDQALALMAEGRRAEASRYAVRAYQLLYFAP